MLTPDPRWFEITEFDRQAFDRFVSKSHPLVIAEREIDWEAFRPILAEFYSSIGQPALDPVRLLKLEFLRYHHGLSDRQVLARAESDLSYRYFLQVGYSFRMPHASVLCRFRGRLGTEGFERVFHQVVAQARQAGLVKDRLRLKDASHVVASIAVPTTLALIAQIRDRLLNAGETSDPEGAKGHRLEAELIRQRTKDDRDEVRLEARVKHLEDILEWSRALVENHSSTSKPPKDSTDSPDPPEPSDPTVGKLRELQKLAEKILHDHDHPGEGKRTLSVVDPDARRGKHGAFYDGYLTDILLDADSEIITNVHVLEACGDEARDAIKLLREEQAAHGNRIESLSMDGIGFHGEVLDELEGINGLGIAAFVPPKPQTGGRFKNTEFQLAADGNHLTCPAGETSTCRSESSTGWTYRFAKTVCASCRFLAQCLGKRPLKNGRTVTKSRFDETYQRVRERAKTPEYAAIRREHPKVERKLNEILNHQQGRRTRYRGLEKVQIAHYMTCLVVNAKRLMKLLLLRPSEADR